MGASVAPNPTLKGSWKGPGPGRKSPGGGAHIGMRGLTAAYDMRRITRATEPTVA